MATTRREMGSPVQMAAMAVGVVFLLIGIAGFIPGVTTDYERLNEFDSEGAKLLGIFAVNWLHNLVHLLFGVAGIAMARMPRSARTYLIGGGAIYAVLFVYGILIDKSSPANFVALNTADNILHLALAVGMVTLGLALGGAAGMAASSRHRRAA